MFTGTISITTDLNTVQNMLGSHRLVIIGEPDQQLIQLTNGIVGSILLPPYPAMMALMDNNMQEFNRIYSEHLSTPECNAFISILVKSMIQNTNNTNILLYMTPDEYNMYYIPFSTYIRNMFGIEIGSQYNNFYYNNAYDSQIYSLLYLNDLITVQELFLVYPAGTYFNDFVVMKLINELRPAVNFTDINQYRQYFYDYKESTKQQNAYVPNLFIKKV